MLGRERRYVRRVSRRDDDLQFRNLPFSDFISLSFVLRTSTQYQIWCAHSDCWLGDIFCHSTLNKLDMGYRGLGAPKLQLPTGPLTSA